MLFEQLSDALVRDWRREWGVLWFLHVQRKPCHWVEIYGGFLKWWYPTTIGFPTENDHFGGVWKHPYIFFVHLFTCQLKQKSKMSGKNLVFIDPKLHSIKSILKGWDLNTIRIYRQWFLIYHQVCLQHLFFGACLNPAIVRKVKHHHFTKGPNHYHFTKGPNHHQFAKGPLLTFMETIMNQCLGRIQPIVHLRCVNWKLIRGQSLELPYLISETDYPPWNEQQVCTSKWMVGRRSGFLLRWPIFRGGVAVSLRECNKDLFWNLFTSKSLGGRNDWNHSRFRNTGCVEALICFSSVGTETPWFFRVFWGDIILPSYVGIVSYTMK